jgi:HAD superfamily hydrolase (TIGR01459 family)
MTARVLSGIHELAEEYDDFLVDLWGTVHDGERVFPAVVQALEELRARKRRVVFLTNTSRTSDLVRELLVGPFGLARELFEEVISSGDVTRAAILSRDTAIFQCLPSTPRCFHFGERSVVPWLFEMGLSFVNDVAEADFIVATGTVPNDAALAKARASLAPAAARDVPLVCTNPDRIIPTANGVTLGPGAIAQAYAGLGGRTFLYGKPHPPIYAAARKRLGADGARVVGIGDLLETDIRGARAAGFASVLVTASGAYAAVLGQEPSTAACDDLFAAEGIAPDMVIPRFAW